MKNLRYWLLGFGVLVSLAGCGGGGGGGGAGSIALQNWSAIVPPSTVDVNAISQDATYTPLQGSPFTDNGVSRDATVTIKYDAAGSIERIDIATQNNLSLLWNVNTGDTINDGNGASEWILLFDSVDSLIDPPEDIALAYNPMYPDPTWEYQTFGAWETGRGTVSGNIGGISMGVPTATDAIPLTDAVLFKGDSTGVYINDSEDFFAISQLSAAVDFELLRIVIDSTDTQTKAVGDLISDEINPWSSSPELDWSGDFFYNIDANDFTGEIKTVSTVIEPLNLSGETTFQFYGPAAEELGGVFSLSNSEINPTIFYSGAYGAVQVQQPD